MVLLAALILTDSLDIVMIVLFSDDFTLGGSLFVHLKSLGRLII